MAHGDNTSASCSSTKSTNGSEAAAKTDHYFSGIGLKLNARRLVASIGTPLSVAGRKTHSLAAVRSCVR